MRSNSKIRFGIIALVAALLLFLIWLLFLRSSSTTEVATGTRPAIGPDGNAVPVAAPKNIAWDAKTAIPERSLLTPDMFRQVTLPAGASTENYVTDIDSKRGFITNRSLPAGAHLQNADLLGHVTQLGVAGLVRPGFRAQVVPIQNKATLHDLIHIGDYVDVIASFDQQESRAIVQNVRVLAVDVYGSDFPQVPIAARGPNHANSPLVSGAPTPTPTAAPANGAPPPAPEAAVTLEVTPQQATNLSLAQAIPAPLDVILRPRPQVTEVVLGTTPGASGTPGAIPVVGTTRVRLAPYAERYKRNPGGGGGNRPAAAASTRSANTERSSSGGGGTRRINSDVPAPDFTSPNIPPAGIGNGSGATTTTVVSPPPPSTYKIPIYGDGKLVREDEVPVPGR